MVIDFVSASMKAGEDSPAEFVGTIKVKVPSFSERLRLQAEFAGKEGGDTVSGRLEMVAALADKVLPMIQEVSIATADGSAVAKTSEDMFNNPAFDKLTAEIALAALRGFAGN